MSELSKSRKKSGTLSHQSYDPTFQKFSQIQLVIPRAVFDQAGIELTYQNVMQLVNEVLLPMPRFQGFRCDRRFWHDHKGNGRVILEKHSMGNILNLTLPEEFVVLLIEYSRRLLYQQEDNSND